MRHVIYYVAASLDGFIAHPDGTFGGFPWNDDFGADLLNQFPETFPAHLKPEAMAAADNQLFDTVLMGRKTYEVGSKAGFTNPYPTLKQYVFSRSMVERPDENVEVVRERAAETVHQLKAGQGKAIWLCGGADLASTLMEAGLLDRLIIKLNPVVFGAGIPLFARELTPTVLEMTGHKAYRSGHMLLYYSVKQRA